MNFNIIPLELCDERIRAPVLTLRLQGLRSPISAWSLCKVKRLLQPYVDRTPARMGENWFISGKLRVCYGKPPSLSSVNQLFPWAILNSYVKITEMDPNFKTIEIHPC